jgi:hypothetical protein
MGGMVLNNDFERMWNGAIVAHIKFCLSIRLIGLKKDAWMSRQPVLVLRFKSGTYEEF